jgi:glycosyltransferase involved in cell wall biosynthesis
MLTPQLPYPPHQGTSLRNLHILRALSHDHDVSLLSFDESGGGQALEPLTILCRVLTPVPAPNRSKWERLAQLFTTRTPDVALRLRNDAFGEALELALRHDQYDAVQIEGIELAGYIPLIRASAPQSEIVLDCHNAETDLQRRAFSADRRQPGRWPAAIYSRVQIARLARFERQALEAADKVIAVSAVDREKLLGLEPDLKADISVLPNTIDVEQYRWKEDVDPVYRHDLVFTGKMDYRPNVDGVLWFADAIWPLILRDRPNTSWAIVGQKPHPRLEPLRGMPGLLLTGRVPDVNPYLAGGSVYIVPLRIGSGTRLKIIEAMAGGLAIVSTLVGVEGLPVKPGENIILAEQTEEWAKVILRLLEAPEERARLGAAAREFAAQYDWRCLIPLLNKLYASPFTRG